LNSPLPKFGRNKHNTETGPSHTEFHAGRVGSPHPSSLCAVAWPQTKPKTSKKAGRPQHMAAIFLPPAFSKTPSFFLLAGRGPYRPVSRPGDASPGPGDPRDESILMKIQCCNPLNSKPKNPKKIIPSPHTSESRSSMQLGSLSPEIVRLSFEAGGRVKKKLTLEGRPRPLSSTVDL